METQEFCYRAKLALQARWWQQETPKVASIGRELTAVKQWRKRVEDDGALILALELYQGPPIAFLWAHKNGNHQLLQRLLAKARQEMRADPDLSTVGSVLNEAMRRSAGSPSSP